MHKIKKIPYCYKSQNKKYKNIVKNATCFKKDCIPSLVDVILTNKPKSCVHTQNFNTGISDCHHLIGTFIKANLPPTKRSTTLCRSYKNFQIESFLEDLNNIDLPGAGIDSTTVNEKFNNFENAFVQIADKHAPWKKRQVRKIMFHI